MEFVKKFFVTIGVVLQSNIIIINLLDEPTEMATIINYFGFCTEIKPEMRANIPYYFTLFISH